MCIKPLARAAMLPCACCLHDITSLVLPTQKTLITPTIHYINGSITPNSASVKTKNPYLPYLFFWGGGWPCHGNHIFIWPYYYKRDKSGTVVIFFILWWQRYSISKPFSSPLKACRVKAAITSCFPKCMPPEVVRRDAMAAAVQAGLPYPDKFTLLGFYQMQTG